MCGINGFLGFKGIEDPELVLQKMNARLEHRGPDASGVYVNKWVGLGHQRLSIIDLSDAGNQPFHSFDGNLTMVFNGEVYNYLELKEELADYPFKTSTDTEVVIAAYQKWGIDFLQRLNGMFAFALWDENEKHLLIARDRLGIKPLYYSYRKDGIVFSSEMRALLESNLVSRKVSKKGLSDYLRYQTVHAPETIIEDVKMLEAGHYLLLTESDLVHEPWWNIAENKGPVFEDRPSILKNVHDKLHRSIELRMRADVPFGAFLSGGIDSSAIVGLMAGVSDYAVSTFSVTFDEKDYSEDEYSNLIAKRFNTNHTEIRLSANDFLNLVPNALEAMDHPSGDGPNTYVVSKVTKESGITMALSGLGGDELFAGYDIFKQATRLLDKRWVSSFPKFMRSMAASAYNAAKPSVAAMKTGAILKEDYLDLEYTYPYSRLTLMENTVKKMMRTSPDPNAVHAFLKNVLRPNGSVFNLPFLSQVSVAEIYTYMQNVLLRDSDQMSMAHALEVRVPFLDHELVEYVIGVSDPEKYPKTPKKLLTDSLGTLLPREIIDRPKMGFTLPWEHWMKSELRSFCESKIENLSNREYFNKSAVLELWQRFLKGDHYISWSRIWHLIVLENWLDANNVE